MEYSFADLDKNDWALKFWHGLMGDEGKTNSHLPFAILQWSLAAVARWAMTNENGKWKMKNGYSLRCFRH
jgi:hypothetical protein